MTSTGRDDQDQYYCYECGNIWQGKRKWLYWPIRLAIQKPLPGVSHKFITKWGWQVGSDRPGVQVFGWTLRIWRLLIKFGNMDYEPEFRYDHSHAVW